MTATIFDIERSSFVDGPGIRTTVFFKGCNLHCAWCHNPESQSPTPQMLFYRSKCTGCGKCREDYDISRQFKARMGITPTQFVQKYKSSK